MGLINFSNYDFNVKCKIFYQVMFDDSQWHIQWSNSEHKLFNFAGTKLEKCMLSDFEDLYRFAKMITYYSFPKKVNLNISSWATTELHFVAITSFIQDFVWSNQLLSAKMLSSVSEQQLQEHLNIIVNRLELKISGSIQRYRNFVISLRDWSDLTRRKLLPKEYGLEVNIDKILTDSICSKCHNLITDQTGTWMPMNPEDIEVAYNDAQQYMYKYAPCIINCQNLIRNRPLVGTIKNSQLGQIRQDGKSRHLFEKLLNIDVPMKDFETKLFNFIPITKKVKSKGYACGWQYRTTIDIREIRPQVIHLKQACIFIIGLLAGLRRREIAELKVNPLFQKNGDWYLAITRFKPSDDAAGLGEPDEIPVPKIVCDAINILIELFQTNREKMKSDYLLVSDILTRKKYEKIKIATVGKDVSMYTLNVTGTSSHAHQLRKTLAWLLISRSEQNIDLIRQLFGHKSYGMTLRYILRNHLVVESVMELLEHNYTEDLSQVFQSIADGKSFGDLNYRIKQRIDEQHYKGQILVTDVESFIHEALNAGVPIFISRLPIGAFCIKAGESQEVPPCMKKSKSQKPLVEFCDYKNCMHVIHTDESIDNINAQITYYKKKQNYLPDNSDERIFTYYETQVIEHNELLERLKESKKSTVIQSSIHA